MSKLNIGGVVEEVITSEEFTLEKARKALKDEVVAIIGYGVQGRGQALNLRDNGINVIVGEEYNTKKAIEDGWVPGKTLFPLMEAAKRGTILQYLMSDAQQKSMWPELKPNLTKGKALYFSHGFSIVYKEQTGVIPPADIDVILVAPKGAGRTVRDNFLAGSGINSSYAVFQDATGRALERTLAVGVAIGSGYLFPTTFEQEVCSDLTGERGVLMGAWPASWRPSTTSCASTATAPARPSTRPSRSSPRASCRWSPRTGWTGCTPTAAPRPSAAPWTGRTASAMPWPPSSANSTIASRPARRRRSF